MALCEKQWQGLMRLGEREEKVSAMLQESNLPKNTRCQHAICIEVSGIKRLIRVVASKGKPPMPREGKLAQLFE